MSQVQNVSRDTKVDLAFAALATGTTIVTLMTPVGLPLMAARVLGTVGANLIGAEAVKAGLNWLNRRREIENGAAAAN